jgi:hypothetical protein
MFEKRLEDLNSVLIQNALHNDLAFQETLILAVQNSNGVILLPIAYIKITVIDRL